MTRADHDSISETRPVPEMLDYAAPPASKPVSFGAPIAILALVAAVFVLLPVLVTWTNGVAAKGRVLFLLFPLAPVVLGVVAMLDRAATPPSRRRARRAVWFGGAELVLMLLAAAVVPNRPHEQANRIKCASNLRYIGKALQMYSNDNGGMYPPSFDELLLTSDIVSEGFICPSTDDDAATGATTQALLQNFHRPGCCSFIYAVGSVNASALTDRHVVAYEPLQNHEGLGANFLYGDGHVEWHRKPEAADIVAKLHAGLNPPWQSATRPRD